MEDVVELALGQKDGTMLELNRDLFVGDSYGARQLASVLSESQLKSVRKSKTIYFQIKLLIIAGETIV